MNALFFRRALTAFISLALVIMMFCCSSVLAAGDGSYGSDIGSDMDYGKVPAASSYKVKVTVKTVTDADGWDAAKLIVYTRKKTGEGKYITRSFDIRKSIDDEGEKATVTFDAGTEFPEAVEVYTDFGGGFSWRSWEGEVRIYVNDRNIEAANIKATSRPFSSSNKTNRVEIDTNKIPDR